MADANLFLHCWELEMVELPILPTPEEKIQNVQASLVILL